MPDLTLGHQATERWCTSSVVKTYGRETRRDSLRQPTRKACQRRHHYYRLLRHRVACLVCPFRYRASASQLTLFRAVWLRVHFSNHPSFPRLSTSKLIYRLWEQLAERNVLVAPGTMFSGRTFGQPDAFDPTVAPPLTMCGPGERLIEKDGDGWFRISFSTASEDDMRTAMKTIGKVTAEFWRDLPDDDE